MFFKKKSTYTDEEVIKAIKKGGVVRQRMTNYLFDKHIGLIYQGQKKFRLELEEAKDVYSDAIIAVSRQIEQEKFRGDSRISTFLFSIFSNRCKNKLRDSKSSKFEWVEEIPNLPDQARSMLQKLIEKEDVEILEKYLSQLGETCRKILWLREFDGFSFEEIAIKIGFKTAQSVSSKKYRCMEKLKILIENNS